MGCWPLGPLSAAAQTLLRGKRSACVYFELPCLRDLQRGVAQGFKEVEGRGGAEENGGEHSPCPAGMATLKGGILGARHAAAAHSAGRELGVATTVAGGEGDRAWALLPYSIWKVGATAAALVPVLK